MNQKTSYDPDTLTALLSKGAPNEQRFLGLCTPSENDAGIPLTYLLKGQKYQASSSIDNALIQGIFFDSRAVTPGSLFIALKPLNGQNEKLHILDAIQKGVKFILKDQDLKMTPDELAAVPPDVVFIDVHNTRVCRAQIAANIYPHQPGKLAAVTGTNGKTSTVTFLRQIWEYCDLKAASIGSLSIQTNVEIKDLPQPYYATPDPFILHKALYMLAEAGVTHAAMEAASHGIDQARLENVKLTAAAFTNLSHEHLDYHKTMEAYFEAKRRLFAEVLEPGSVAVLNADDTHFKVLYDTCRARGHEIISFGHEGSEIQLLDANLSKHGQQLTLKIFGQSHQLFVPLIGLVQGYNVMTAIGLAIGCGLELQQILPAIAHLKSVPGRFEHIGQHPSGGQVYVDYAHKPLALETVLRSLRPHAKGLLTVVFGCGGDRDTQKRPMMGEIAATFADRVIVTDDNPRSENPKLIRQQILKGCPAADEIADRQQAIAEALAKLESQDICVIAGKGHEKGQIVGDQILPFDDREIARAELNKLGGTVL
jgi:UDP-N-acetylmuramoyl-L-alanyl-D-glutamate--2,6-diaminopimelate ligase